jgi:hypothetical protein
MLNLTHLKVLDAVASHGSVTEAAKELHYSHGSQSGTRRPPRRDHTPSSSTTGFNDL